MSNIACPLFLVCKAEMRIISFITDYQEVIKILRHIGEETIRPPPFLPEENLEFTYETATDIDSTMV